MDSLRWLLATHNQGKIRELRAILAPWNLAVTGLAEAEISAESPETADDFLGNAMQKAAFYFAQGGMPVVADDSGLEVDALNGAPGVHSSRFGGYASHAEKMAYLLRLLKGIELPYRTARFRCAAVYFDGRRFVSAEASLEGLVGLTGAGDGGFGYDPIFYPNSGKRSLAEIGIEEKNKISHRGTAFRELVAAVLEPMGGLTGQAPRPLLQRNN